MSSTYYQLEDRCNRAYENNRYWMDYMTPLGMPCNRAMMEAADQLRSAEAELREYKNTHKVVKA